MIKEFCSLYHISILAQIHWQEPELMALICYNMCGLQSRHKIKSPEMGVTLRNSTDQIGLGVCPLAIFLISLTEIERPIPECGQHHFLGQTQKKKKKQHNENLLVSVVFLLSAPDCGYNVSSSLILCSCGFPTTINQKLEMGA